MKTNNLVIRPFKKSDSANASLIFISELIDEEVYILYDRKMTLKEEKAWLKDKLRELRHNQQVALSVWDGQKLVAVCDAKKGKMKERDNTLIGIAILKAYRGKGLGEKLLRAIIKLAKEKLKPKNIYLSVFADNKVAQNLYKKVGFRQFAIFPKWMKHKGKYVDSLYMLLAK
ncbi:MAG: GNAT family protein [Candidatus Micrarchaeota archaeon]|nr:GNAT family protein [Candidatus Micrarchaeota archaeon]